MGLPLGTNVIIVSLVFTVLDVVVLAARFWSIWITKNKVHLDDYLIILGVLATIAQCVLCICNVQYASLGYHLQYTPEGIPIGDAAEKVDLYDRLAYALQLTVPIGNTFIKLSILFFLRRIFRGRTFNICSWLLIGLSTVWGISIFFATLFECTPPQDVFKAAWSTPANTAGRHCYFPLTMFYANVTSDMLIDFLIWTLPHPFVWRLHMPMRRRIGVSAVFAVGLVVIAVGICRVYFIFNIALTDFTYTEAPSQYWTVIESAVANFCACLPTMGASYKVAGAWGRQTLYKFRSYYYSSKAHLKGSRRGRSGQDGTGRPSSSESGSVATVDFSGRYEPTMKAAAAGGMPTDEVKIPQSEHQIDVETTITYMKETA